MFKSQLSQSLELLLDNCPDIRNSKVFDLIKELEKWGLKLVLIDPWANKKKLKKNMAISFQI